MKPKNLVLLVVEENEMPKRQSLKLIHQLVEKLDAHVHLYMNVYRREYEEVLDPGEPNARLEAHHVVSARHWLSRLRNTLSKDIVVSGETLNWKHPNSETLPVLISTLSPQYIVAVRPERKRFKRSSKSRQYWYILSTCGVPVVFTDSDYRIGGSREVWAAVDVSNKQGDTSGLNDLIVRQAQYLASLYGGDVHLAHCHHTGYQLTEYVLSLSQSESIPDLQELRRSRDEHQVPLDALATKHGIPAKNIYNFPGVAKVMLPILSSRNKPLFVVAGSTQKSPVRRWLVGSTSKTLLKRLTVPLCLVSESAVHSTDEPVAKGEAAVS